MSIPEQVLSPQAFLNALHEGGVALDVRSPSEHAQGHLPGAESFPLFSDAERAQVGTEYTQVGKQEAVELGLDLVGTKMRELVVKARALFEAQGTRRPLLIHCWRGGMRSESVDWLLRTAGIPTRRCEGGYKACRAVMRQALGAPRNYMVLGGMTGTAKTEVLRALARRGEHVLDLEGLARHYGSAFGNLDRHTQPTTEQFANDLAFAICALKDAPATESGVVWVENESRQIGKVYMPEMFHKRLKQAPVMEIERTEDDRIAHLLAMYGGASREGLAAAFRRIRTKLGGQHAQAAVDHVMAGDLAAAARIALTYYDKTYQHGLDQRVRRHPVDGRGLDPDRTATRCLETLAALNV
jgi:tRNA 2-selenouridine synthase